MPVVSHDGLGFSSLAWTFKLLPITTKRPAYGMLGHLSVHFIDQHMVL